MGGGKDGYGKLGGKGEGGWGRRETVSRARHSWLSFLAPIDTTQKEPCGPLSGRDGSWRPSFTHRAI